MDIVTRIEKLLEKFEARIEARQKLDPIRELEELNKEIRALNKLDASK